MRWRRWLWIIPTHRECERTSKYMFVPCFPNVPKAEEFLPIGMERFRRLFHRENPLRKVSRRGKSRDNMIPSLHRMRAGEKVMDLCLHRLPTQLASGIGRASSVKEIEFCCQKLLL
ncbi:unnamed protein product [Linum tenue]|uniref:Uncharacterized protein n=1 Tax=Linum tenue TaxID=586396 RepID=A0AAV0I809_9ROSI|nr:unnamed protein product [Linum tenue]